MFIYRIFILFYIFINTLSHYVLWILHVTSYKDLTMFSGLVKRNQLNFILSSGQERVSPQRSSTGMVLQSKDTTILYTIPQLDITERALYVVILSRKSFTKCKFLIILKLTPFSYSISLKTHDNSGLRQGCVSPHAGALKQFRIKNKTKMIWFHLLHFQEL